MQGMLCGLPEPVNFCVAARSKPLLSRTPSMDLQGPGHRHLQVPASRRHTPTWVQQATHPPTPLRAAIHPPPSRIDMIVLVGVEVQLTSGERSPVASIARVEAAYGAGRESDATLRTRVQCLPGAVSFSHVGKWLVLFHAQGTCSEYSGAHAITVVILQSCWCGWQVALWACDMPALDRQ